MKDYVASAMGRALEQTRAGNPLEATRILQSVLGDREAPLSETRPDLDVSRKAGWRRPLGQIVDSLVNGRSVANRPARTAVPAIPEGARYETRTHDCVYGSREYRLFVPSDRQDPVQGLVLMLHGCTQTSDDFAAGTRMNLVAERHNFMVVYPQQAPSANQLACWNWFRPEDQRHGNGEPALLADLAGAVSAEFTISDRFVAGLSAGGAMAAILGSEYPDLFTAVGVHSGLAPGSARDVASAYAAMGGQPGRPTRARRETAPTIIFHGTSDTTVSPANADAVTGHATGSASATVIEDHQRSGATCTVHRDPRGRTLAEDWRVPGMGHAWSGGSADGSHTYPEGPDASEEIVRFFIDIAREVRS